MLDKEWEKLKYFKKDEKPFGWGDATKINFSLLYWLDCFREYINQPIIVICGTQGKHLGDTHARGLAIDIVIDSNEKLAIDLFLSVERFPFTGIGIYPFAKYTPMKKPFGMHLDVRPVTNLPRGVIGRRWIGIPKDDLIETYPLNLEHLHKFGVICRNSSYLCSLCS